MTRQSEPPLDSSSRQRSLNAPATIFVVGNDKPTRDRINRLSGTMGFPIEVFVSAEAFLEQYTPECPGCVITELRLPGMSGTALQRRMKANNIPLPVVVIASDPTTPTTVEAIQQGAVTLLEMPIQENQLWQAMREAIQLDIADRQQREYRSEIRMRVATLTSKEREVMDRVVAGKANKIIASELGTSVRTIENRRARIFHKMEAESIAELVRMMYSPTR